LSLKATFSAPKESRFFSSLISNSFGFMYDNNH